MNKRQYLTAILETQAELGDGGAFLEAHVKGVEAMPENEFQAWLERIVYMIRRRWHNEQAS